MNEYVFGDKLKYKSLVVGNPFDAQYIRYKADHAELTNQSDIIYLGRLTEAKNPFVFLDIIQDLKQKIPDLKVSMVGAGELESEVRQKIKDYALDSTITMYGFQENPYGLLKNSKVLCIPSKWEGFGLVAIEALSLGKPVVASNVGGLKNIINDECGFVGDTQEGLEKALYELLTDENIYTKKSNSALKRVKIYDNVDAYCKQLLDIYYGCVK